MSDVNPDPIVLRIDAEGNPIQEYSSNSNVVDDQQCFNKNFTANYVNVEPQPLPSADCLQSIRTELYSAKMPSGVSLEEILRRSGLRESIIITILGAGYQNLWHLLQFEETEMLELFPFNRQMERVEFRYFLNKIRSSVSISQFRCNSVASCSTMSNIDEYSSVPDSPISDNNTITSFTGGSTNSSLSDILKSNGTGVLIIEHYACKGHLTEPQKTRIVDIITEYFLSNNATITQDQFRFYASEIVKMFPNEIEETYFRPRGKNRKNPQGILYDKYRNKLQRLRKAGLLTSKKTTRPASRSTSTAPIVGVGLIDIGEYQNIKTHLKHNFEIDPSEAVLNDFKKTVNNRSVEYKTDAFADVLTSWPLLKSAKSPLYIDIDFNFIHPNKDDILFRKWNDFLTKIEVIYSSDLKENPIYLSRNEGNEDSRDYKYTVLLHNILKPTARINKASSKSNEKTRVTIGTSQYNQIVYLPNLNDLQSVIEEKRNHCTASKITLQPFIFVVGETVNQLQGFFVYFDNNYHKVTSLLKALDFCFKIFQVFNLSYPKECQQVWTFFQRYIFEISTEFDVCTPKIYNLISRLH